jgi:hypothetical protein
MTPEGFRELCERVGVVGEVVEVDGSSVVCEVSKGVGRR